MNTLMVFLDAIRDHLDLHYLPDVASLDIGGRPGRPVVVQLGTRGDLAALAGGLLRWAATLDEVTASIWRVSDGGSVHLSISGRMPCGVPVDVYGGVLFEEAAFPDLPAGARQDMPVFVLHSWARPEGVAA
ncbi:hypothetical protein ATK36_6336 [Amycolatopsis sulphurea]|uniref:Uncharacterized protein n=1 Tax=Amycolatopsis sulphurea TaxID=76022 RepID=A0A2A9FJF0_9PSEU|nr:hypothetical protein [Amycolatopsis sulphurea]PFG51063.1 hypothetical protein ATK36_6336 [Amycolatopsis sulphurea]